MEAEKIGWMKYQMQSEHKVSGSSYIDSHASDF